MSKDIEKKIRQTFLDSISVKKEIVDNDLDLVLLEAGKVIADSIANGGKLLICGNGGSGLGETNSPHHAQRGGARELVLEP